MLKEELQSMEWTVKTVSSEDSLENLKLTSFLIHYLQIDLARTIMKAKTKVTSSFDECI